MAAHFLRRHRDEHRARHFDGAHTPATEGEVLVERCEQFLTGRLLDDFSGDAGSVPPWVWINLLAHGTEESLHVWASRRTDRADGCLWERTLSCLSALLLDHAAQRDEPVVALQRAVVVPIEIGLAHQQLAPSSFVRMVSAALGRNHQDVAIHRAQPSAGVPTPGPSEEPA